MANYGAATRDFLTKKHPGAAPRNLHSKWMYGAWEGRSPDILGPQGSNKFVRLYTNLANGFSKIRLLFLDARATPLLSATETSVL